MSTAQQDIQYLPLDKLDFDPQNPRFSRYFANDPQPEDHIVERMIKNEIVQELMGSIAEQGYFSGEPLLVAKNGKRYIVVEGNRRLAAVKLLRGDIASVLPSIKQLRETAKHIPPENIPCIVFPERKDILRYLGYRHITGAKRWESLSKARYLEELRQTFFADLPLDEQLKSIAQEIGSKPHYGAQMLTGLTVFERARDTKFYGLQRVSEDDVDFGVLTTALSRTAIAQYIGLENPRDIEASQLNLTHAKDLFAWMFAQNEQGNTVLGESRNLSKLAAIVANDSAIEELKQSRDLDRAFLFSDGQTAAFGKVLRDAEKKLRDVYNLTSEINDFTDEHEQQIQKIVDLADSVQFFITKSRKRKGALRD